MARFEDGRRDEGYFAIYGLAWRGLQMELLECLAKADGDMLFLR